MEDTERATFDFQKGPDGQGHLTLQGRLDRDTVASLWPPSTQTLRQAGVSHLIIQAGAVTYCDGAGLALLTEYQHIQQEHRGQMEIRNLRPEFQQLMTLLATDRLVSPPPGPGPMRGTIRGVGEWFAGVLLDAVAGISFTGEISLKLSRTLLHPRELRWKDALIIAEKAGANAVGIVGLLGFLIGLILAFQTAAALRQFGAEVYVADLVVIVLFRELGPLFTAFLLTSRSASAFAAEVGTMKVNEEIDALVTMGLDPVRFLVLPRLVAVLCVIPLLTVFHQLLGLIGCGLVMASWNVPATIYLERIRNAATLTDFFGGLVKTFVFGALVAGVGCLRGLQTRTGPTAVGDATTRAVVSGMIAIIAADGVFAVLYYYLGI
jgi:phospholipid/cholesterol/gamma-HCH transport system permease protein